jgi:flagellar hook-length control protein FliK
MATGTILDARAPAAAPAATAAAPDQMVERQLDVAADGEWLDQIARDIARAGGSEGRMSFRLSPEHLGRLTVELAQNERGTSIRLTADSEAARNLLVEAQPKLVAEARAQGVRIAETHVGLAGGQAGDSRRQDSERRDPQLRAAREIANSEEPARDPPRTGSDRYA